MQNKTKMANLQTEEEEREEREKVGGERGGGGISKRKWEGGSRTIP